jgi:hypothetical protein
VCNLVQNNMLDMFFTKFFTKNCVVGKDAHESFSAVCNYILFWSVLTRFLKCTFKTIRYFKIKCGNCNHPKSCIDLCRLTLNSHFYPFCFMYGHLDAEQSIGHLLKM